jgi:hypothetical protein
MTTHRLPYSLVHNDPPGGGSWRSVNIIVDGHDYPIADGSMTKRYAWLTPPPPGQEGELVESDTLARASAKDVLVFINHDGQLLNAVNPSAMLREMERIAADAKTTLVDRPRVGPALRALRESTGLTLREFCARAGFDHGFVSRVERDVFRPKASWLEAYLETAGEILAEAKP